MEGHGVFNSSSLGNLGVRLLSDMSGSGVPGLLGEGLRCAFTGPFGLRLQDAVGLLGDFELRFFC